MIGNYKRYFFFPKMRFENFLKISIEREDEVINLKFLNKTFKISVEALAGNVMKRIIFRIAS